MRILVAVAALALPLYCQQSVEYRLRFPNAAHHEAQIRAVFKGVGQPVLEVVMSRSSPGRYALHEFAKNVYNVRATNPEGQRLTVSRPNPYGWNISGHHGIVIVDYTLYGDHSDGTYAGIDETHAHLNLPAALMWAHGFEHAPATLAFEMPPASHWRAATQLVPQPDGTWSAPNLEWLMDSPVELSDYSLNEWKIDDATFRLALHAHASAEQAKAYAQKCAAVVLEEEGVFGAFPKFDNGTYTFLIDYLPYVFGDGMEHRDSTVISGPHELNEAARFPIGAVSHEFFHAWNVKRIRPRSLEPFDFERADMSGELWFAEGFTNYYGPLTLKRAGLSTLDEFLQDTGRAVNDVLNDPGREVFDVIDMSRMAPFVDAAKSIDATNFKNTFISYYTYGQALALGIDLSIRHQFPGKSLDDWMRTMWREHPDIDRPYTLADLQQTLGETVGDERFAQMIFEGHIFGKEPLDYQTLLSYAGLKLQKAHPGRAWVGASALTLSDSTLIGSPLYKAGLDAGDQIEECDGKPVKNDEEFSACLGKHLPGDKLKIAAHTRAGKKTVQLDLVEDPSLEIIPFEKASVSLTTEVNAFRSAWLSSRSPHAK